MSNLSNIYLLVKNENGTFSEVPASDFQFAFSDTGTVLLASRSFVSGLGSVLIGGSENTGIGVTSQPIISIGGSKILTSGGWSVSVGGYKNISLNGAIVLGGTENSGNQGIVFGGTKNISNYAGLVLGGESNNSKDGTNIIGGSGNFGNSFYSLVLGGINNSINSPGFTTTSNSIIGGNENLIQNESLSSVAASEKSTILGRNGNFEKGCNSIIAGSNSLISGSNGSIIFGSNNIITGSRMVIVAGNANTGHASRESYVLGGRNNMTCRSCYSVIVGGNNNMTTGCLNAIIGGEYNQNYSNGSYIFGSNSCIAGSASRSLAIGNQVKILNNHTGAAVIADGNSYDHNSSGPNTLTLDFSNGIVINTSNGLFINGNKVNALSESFQINTNIPQNLTGLYV